MKILFIIRFFLGISAAFYVSNDNHFNSLIKMSLFSGSILILNLLGSCVHLGTVAVAKGMESTDWQRLEIGSTPRGEEQWFPSGKSQNAVYSRRGMGFELTEQGVIRPDHKGLGM